MMPRLLTLFSALILALWANTAKADGPCPNGRFNPHVTVCMCPNGGYVRPNGYCPTPKRQEYWVTTYNAIAIDMTIQRESAGYANSDHSQEDADQQALKQCDLETCQVVLRFVNQCGAIAIDPMEHTLWGGAAAGTPQQAEQLAMQQCMKIGGKNCVMWTQGPRCAGAYGYGNPHYR